MTQYYIKRGMPKWLVPFAYLVALLLTPVYLLVMLVGAMIDGIKEYYWDHVVEIWYLLKAPFSKDFWEDEDE